MNRRTKEIEAAIVMAKKAANYRCLVCGRGKEHGERLHGSHLLPRNNPAPRNDPTNPDYIMALCVEHDLQYDAIKLDASRVTWLSRHGLHEYAERLKSMIQRVA